MTPEHLRSLMREVARDHLAKNIRNYSYSRYDGLAHTNALGGTSYLRPTEGKVVTVIEGHTVVKTAASQFTLVSSELLSQPVRIGDKIGLTFYNLRRFDGTNADGTDDPAAGGVKSYSLTGTQTYFPVKWEGRELGINNRFREAYTEIKNPYLQDLIRQLEQIPVNGGLRKIVNVLVDANGRNLRFVDPGGSSAEKPAILVDVETAKHKGLVDISYDRGADWYCVRLVPADGTPPQDVEPVYVDQLADVLIDGIDDGEWRKATVTMIKAAPKARAQPALI